MTAWKLDLKWNSWCREVPTKSFKDPGVAGGVYRIWITPRPIYCDRGDWMIYIEEEGDHMLDFADGFPRYFFGTAEEAQKQMDTWVSRRKEVYDEIQTRLH